MPLNSLDKPLFLDLPRDYLFVMSLEVYLNLEYVHLIASMSMDINIDVSLCSSIIECSNACCGYLSQNIVLLQMGNHLNGPYGWQMEELT